jgi:MFS family permease
VPAFPALRELLVARDFRKLFAVRLMGQFSDGLLQASLATFVLFSPERQPDAVKVASAFAILLLPYSLIGPFAGVFLDRWRRRNVLVRANALKAVATIPIVLLVAVGNDGALLGLSVLIVLGIGRFVLAGLSASLPHVVSGRDLVTANALTPTAGTIMSAVGAVVGVWLRSAVGGGDAGSQVVLVAAIIGFLLAGLIATRIGVNLLGPSGERPAQTMAGVARGFVVGLDSLRRARVARRATTAVAAHRIAFGILTVGALLLVRNTFNVPTDADAALGQFAVITGFAAGGALIGAVTTPVGTRRLGTIPWSVAALLQGGILGIGLILIGSSRPSLPALLAGAASIGFTGQALKVCADTLLQRHIADDRLGRVFALFDMIVNVCLVLGVTFMAFTCPPSGQAPAMYLATGGLLIGTGCWYWLRQRSRLLP